MKRETSPYRIAIVNNADPSKPEHWDPREPSVRETRMVRRTLKLRREGNKNALLFKFTNEGRVVVSLRPREPRVRVRGHNTAWVGKPISPNTNHARQAAAKLDTKATSLTEAIPDALIDAYRFVKSLKERKLA